MRILCLLLLVATPWPLLAHDDAPIVTDRPNFAASSLTVGFLRTQIETGLDVAWLRREAAPNTITLTLPTKLRFGVWDWAEIHIESPALIHQKLGAQDQTGVADFDFGGKVTLVTPDMAGAGVPSLGFLVALTAPIGTGGFSSDTLTLTPTLAADWTLTSTLSLTVNLGASVPLTQRDNAADVMRYAITLGYAPSALGGLYLEVFGLSELNSEGATALFTDAGAALLIQPWIQLDAYIRVGLNNAAGETLGGGTGLSFLF